MGEPVEVEMDYFLQAFRLHQRMTRDANRATQETLRTVLEIAGGSGRDNPRARGLLAFTQLTAWLNDWIDAPAAAEMLDAVKSEITRRNGELNHDPLDKVIPNINSLSGDSPREAIVSQAIVYHAASAVLFDPVDYDNHWSLGTANLYAKDFPSAESSYGAAKDRAAEQAPVICACSLEIDRADYLFFRAPFEGSGAPPHAQVLAAIDTAKAAIARAEAEAPHDTKRHRWNWTLGWAYFEANQHAKSLARLLQIRNPHDLIVKNIIASYVGLGRKGPAKALAVGFLERNPDYTLAIEDRWPYEDPARRDRWKDHLREAGLPD
jgi:hypothetical protein